MVRLTLQPLVENIFQHAFPQGIDDHHHIKIDARIADDQFQVFVVDNGVGIAPDPLLKLRERLQQNRLAEADSDKVYHSGGIGLMNVHRRIQLVFGEQYCVTVDSIESQGTRVTMSMPIDQKRKRI
jgi:two-component system sensor histidine kinase YesM